MSWHNQALSCITLVRLGKMISTETVEKRGRSVLTLAEVRSVNLVFLVSSL